jgi:hypothetical protein
VDFTRFDLAGLTLNDAATFNADHSPSEDPIVYYVTYELGGVVKGTSVRFSCAHDGTYQINGYLFDVAGTWHIIVRKDSDDSSVKDQTVTVS